MPDSRSRAASLGLTALLVAGATAALGQGLPASDIALLLSGEEGGTLRVESHAVTWPSADGLTRMRVTAEIPMAALLAVGEATVDLRWAIYVVDEEGGVVASRVRPVSAHLERLAASDAAGVRLLETLDVPAGTLSVRILARLIGAPDFGLREQRVIVKAGGSPAGAYVPRQTAGWIEIGAAGDGGGPESPSGLAVVSAGTALTVLTGPGGDPSVRWVLVSPTGGAPRTVAALPGEAPAAGAAWREVRIGLPSGVAGRFLLRREDAPEGTGVPLLILPSARAASGSWAQLAAPAPTAAAIVQLEPAGRGRLGGRAARRSLGQALTLLADEGVAIGAESLAAVFDDAWAEAGADGIESVVLAGRRLGARLLRADSTSLVPVIAALERLYQRCTAERRSPCAAGARLLLTDLLEMQPVRPETAELTAAAWTVLGWQLLEVYLFQSAERCLAEAVRLAPGLEAASLALAALYEGSGKYAEAANVLGTALERGDAPAEARLRRAVQWVRLGRERRAIDELAMAARPGAPDWVRIVAYEELADLQLRLDGPGAAEATLREALREFPGREQLVIQLAALLESTGRHSEAANALEALAAPSVGEAARGRYGTWPRDELSAVQQRLEAQATERLPELRAALESIR